MPGLESPREVILCGSAAAGGSGEDGRWGCKAIHWHCVSLRSGLGRGDQPMIDDLDLALSVFISQEPVVVHNCLVF